ncbi:Neuronal acetylcholine receptor subunit alpha-7 [Trachymyrmex zeteki]|uniref:Neuronal acetylcholine receptor subunit alpha-7 n=1 Tax=Mycetomoellerius zeteki TaxID=64791 RepID=A0A151WKI1_9HYME|nr:Neuronal acetylcholine receptor subunit alpha-7 [Trachymyrmex zeteki]
MSNFVPEKRHLREVLLHYFFLKKSAAESHRLLVKAYKKHAPSVSMCEKWFKRFKSNNFDLYDKKHGKPPKKFEDAQLEALIDEDACQTEKELATALNVTQQCISLRLRAMGRSINAKETSMAAKLSCVFGRIYAAFLAFSLIPFFTLSVCDEHEYRLTKHLLDAYDAGVRPAKNSSQPLVVVFGLSLHHIIDVDEKNQILTTNCWVTQVWTDHHLKWNASEFAGIRVIRVPYNRVWRPDTILYNNADPQYSSAVINTNVIVSHTGEVVWLSHGIFRSSCDINVEFFPFDEQRCALKWASWTYDGYQTAVTVFPSSRKERHHGLELERQSEQGDVSNYQANGEFHLLDFTARRNVEYYSCCEEPYPDITYEIRLRRRPMFYVFNLILPCILINGVALRYSILDLQTFEFFTRLQIEVSWNISDSIFRGKGETFANAVLVCSPALLVFYVPSESGEKVTLGISALLSMTVFLMTIRETLPPTEKTPLISLYYGVSICLVSFASGLAVVTLNLHHRGVRGIRVPSIVRSLVLDKLARIVFLNFQEENRSQEPAEQFPRRKNNCPLHCKPELPEQHVSPKYVSRKDDSNSSSPSLDLGKEGGLEAHWSRVLGRVHATIERNERRLVEQDRRERTELDWKQVALVSDRALLCIFLLTTIVSTAVILCGSPPTPDASKDG